MTISRGPLYGGLPLAAFGIVGPGQAAFALTSARHGRRMLRFLLWVLDRTRGAFADRHACAGLNERSIASTIRFQAGRRTRRGGAF